jgi:uncharacterized membrane protein
LLLISNQRLLRDEEFLVVSVARAPALLTTKSREGTGPSPPDIQPARLACVDLLRGTVMLLMALDHARRYFTASNFTPEDLAHTSGAIFFTRLITHFCAPVFFLLVGVGTFLSVSQGRSVAQVSHFLWTRGLWLMFLELTIIGYAWTFVFPFGYGGVIWALGLSMIAMALIVRLQRRSIAVLGTAIIVGHNLLDRITPAEFDRLSGIWFILHQPGTFWIKPGQVAFLVVFPLIPWVGVMALGYVLGALLLREDRRKVIFAIGAVLTISFFLLRAFNLYGNGMATHAVYPDAAGPWKPQPTMVLTIVSFLNTQKYPASLQFLLMTLGPSLMALTWFDKIRTEGGLAGVLLVFGRVPLFYYVLHLYFIHAMAVWIALAFHQPTAWLLYGGFLLNPVPNGYGHGLPFIYAMSAIAVGLLYLPCKWFMNFKQEHKSWWWLSYI